VGSLKLKSENRREFNVSHINYEIIDYTNGQDTYIKEAKITSERFTSHKPGGEGDNASRM
jgi:hypothetical protein